MQKHIVVVLGVVFADGGVSVVCVVCSLTSGRVDKTGDVGGGPVIIDCVVVVNWGLVVGDEKGVVISIVVVVSGGNVGRDLVVVLGSMVKGGRFVVLGGSEVGAGGGVGE